MMSNNGGIPREFPAQVLTSYGELLGRGGEGRGGDFLHRCHQLGEIPAMMGESWGNSLQLFVAQGNP